MGLREILTALARRWYVLVVGLLLTVGAGWYVYQDTPPDYTARSLTLLLPPAGVDEEAGSNPFLQLGGLELTARVLVATYSGTAFQDEIAERSPDAEVVVSMEESTQGGVIAVDVLDKGADATMELLDEVTATVSERLAGLQTEVGVSERDTVRSLLLAQDTEATPEYQDVIRILVLVAGAGIAATLVVTLLLDLLLTRRRRRKSGAYLPGSWRERRKRSAASTAQNDETVDDTDPSADVPVPTDLTVLSSSPPAMARRAVPGRMPLNPRDPS